MEFRLELETAIRAARVAGEVIAAYYARGSVQVDVKADASPVTQADRDADAAIAEVIRAAFPEDAILSEETPDDQTRLAKSRVWVIDPLDGTRDFVERTDDFAVHVGFTVDGAVVAGAVYLPVPREMYSAAIGGGAWREVGDQRTRLEVSNARSIAKARIGISRHHVSDRLRACLETAQVAPPFPIGASIKHMMLARGELDAVINLGSAEMEWDSCAPEIVIREAGGTYTHGDGTAFHYNNPDLVHRRGSIASNGSSHPGLIELVRPYLP